MGLLGKKIYRVKFLGHETDFTHDYYWAGEGEAPSYEEFTEAFYAGCRKDFDTSEEEIQEALEFMESTFEEQEKLLKKDEEKYFRFSRLDYEAYAVPNLEEFGFSEVKPEDRETLQIWTDRSIHELPSRFFSEEEMRKMYGDKWVDATLEFWKKRGDQNV